MGTNAVEWLGVADEAWDAVVARSAAHDVYHRAGYHAVAEGQGEGEARLLVHRDRERFIAMPMLVRPIPMADPGLRDASSAYGYAGPITSETNPTAELVAGFQASLRKAAERHGLVSLFARLHPLLLQAPLLDGLGEIRHHGNTISIDLTRPPAEQTAAYSTNHRRNLDKLRKTGFACRFDPSDAALDGFIAVYHENMQRVGATDFYFFPRAYFLDLRARLGERLQLLLCEQDGALAGGALFMIEDGTVQYHLGAVADAFLRQAPLKLLLDEARRLFSAEGREVLHLGGGRGGGEDSLFHFKAGFSDRRHPFATWRWIADPDRYGALTAARGVDPATGFFPAYRA